MKKVAKRELIVWSVCMLFGGTILCAELTIASQRSARHSISPLMPDVRAVHPERAAHPQDSQAEDQKRLVTDLLVDAVIQIESAGDPRVVGSHGERGLMQVKAGTWAEVTSEIFGSRVSFSKAFDPELNRRVGTAYLSKLHVFLQRNKAQWHSDERSLLLACYNAGPQKVARSGFSVRNLPSSAKDYVQRASALHDSFLQENAIKINGAQIAEAGMPVLRPRS